MVLKMLQNCIRLIWGKISKGGGPEKRLHISQSAGLFQSRIIQGYTSQNHKIVNIGAKIIMFHRINMVHT